MSRNQRLCNERGAVIIHVAIALVALLAFTAMVVDYGVMWVSRRQAQNVVDSAALAGALALVWGDSPTAAAQHFAAQNPIWGQGNSAANVDVALSGATLSIWPCGAAPGCVRADVFRNAPDRTNATRGNVIPTYFAHIVGLDDQRVRATATARTSNGNSVRCLLPFAVIDRWADNYDLNVDTSYFPNDGLTGTSGWTQNDLFQDWRSVKKGKAPANDDVYIAPYGNNASHTGWQVTVDYGRQLILKSGSPGTYSSGWANEVDLPDSTGSKDYKWNIQNCNEQPVGIAQESEACTGVNEAIGCLSVKTGVSQGPTSQGIGSFTQGLVGQDPSAQWSWSAPGPNGQSGGVVDSSGAADMGSPRIRPIAIIDINHYINEGCSGTTCIAKVANIIGFFVEGMCNDVAARGGLDQGGQGIAACPNPNKDVVGRIVTLPGTFATTGAGTVDNSASFVKVVQLVR
jgi:hypothetical protein